MNHVQAYLRKKTLPHLDEIEDIATDIANFISRYLACGPHQLTLLALWVIYCWNFEHFSSAVYLNIRSPETQTGKSLCLELMGILCPATWLATGAESRTLTSRLLTSHTRVHEDDDFDPQSPNILLLDDCHQTFHSSRHQALVAILNSGARASGRYVQYSSEYCVFGPKAFAGNAPLPESLASRCIPIVLHRKRPTDNLTRLNSAEDADNASLLLDRLSEWTKDEHHVAVLTQAARSTPLQMPAGLTPREQECAEPLLHIADRIGGLWPERARAALAAAFNLAETSLSVKLLSDIRAAFTTKDNPEHLTTEEILGLIAASEYHPWSAWPHNSGRRLASLLRPFGIQSRNLRLNPEVVVRGYLQTDFHEVWDRYLPPALSPVSCSATDSPSLISSATVSPAIQAPCSR